ncbi:MAG: diacylglycerol/lipid kinase family protein [Phycisphaerae bacterium]
MENRRSVIILANPTSGRGRAIRTARAVASLLRARGADVAIHETTGSGDAETFSRTQSRSEDRPGVIVACGGDGTIQQVVNALAPLKPDLGDRCPVVGIAPAGRCNDFSHNLGIPGDPGRIADILLTGTARPVDLGQVNGRYYCTVVTVGIDADISSYVDTMKMPLRGTPAYIYGTLQVLRKYRGRSIRVSGDVDAFEQHVFLASTANTPSYGGAIGIVPHASPFDGTLDFCLIDRLTRMRSVAMLVRVLRGTHVDRPEVHFAKAKQLRIETDDPVDLWADGERIGTTPAEINVAAGAVRILLPSSTDARTG